MNFKEFSCQKQQFPKPLKFLDQVKIICLSTSILDTLSTSISSNFRVLKKSHRILHVLPLMTSNFERVLEHFKSKIMKIQGYAPPPEPGPKNRFP